MIWDILNIFRGWTWHCGYCDFRPVCVYRECVLVSRATTSRLRLCCHLVPARWSNSTYCSAVDLRIMS